ACWNARSGLTDNGAPIRPLPTWTTTAASQPRNWRCGSPNPAAPKETARVIAVVAPGAAEAVIATVDAAAGVDAVAKAEVGAAAAEKVAAGSDRENRLTRPRK